MGVANTGNNGQGADFGVAAGKYAVTIGDERTGEGIAHAVVQALAGSIFQWQIFGNDGIPLGNIYAHIRRDKLQIRVLTDCRDNGIALDDEFTARNRFGAATARGIRFAHRHPDTFHAGYLFIGINNDPGRQYLEFKLNALFLGAIHFPDVGRHLLAGAAVKQNGFFRSFAKCNAYAVDGGISAAHHADFLAHAGRLAHIGFAEEVDSTGEKALVTLVFAFNAHRFRTVGAGRKEYCIMFLFEFRQGDILADPAIVHDFNTHGLDDVNISLEKVTRHPVGRDAYGNHTAAEAFRQRLVNGALVTFKSQIIGCGKAGRTCANNANGLVLS